MASSNNVKNVSVGKGAAGGYAFYAPYGTDLPTDNTSSLDTAFRNIGFIKEDTLKLQYGDGNVTTATNTITAKDKGPNTAQYSVVFDFRLKDGRKERCVVPVAQVSELGDLVYNYQELVGREITMSASLDSDAGAYYIRYIDSTEGGE